MSDREAYEAYAVDYFYEADADLLQAIVDELCDETYPNRIHHSRATYALGCRGPLCRKSERDRGSRRFKERHPESRSYNPSTARQDDAMLEAFAQFNRKLRRTRPLETPQETEQIGA